MLFWVMLYYHNNSKTNKDIFDIYILTQDYWSIIYFDTSIWDFQGLVTKGND